MFGHSGSTLLTLNLLAIVRQRRQEERQSIPCPSSNKSQKYWNVVLTISPSSTPLSSSPPLKPSPLQLNTPIGPRFNGVIFPASWLAETCACPAEWQLRDRRLHPSTANAICVQSSGSLFWSWFSVVRGSSCGAGEATYDLDCTMLSRFFSCPWIALGLYLCCCLDGGDLQNAKEGKLVKFRGDTETLTQYLPGASKPHGVPGSRCHEMCV